MFQILIVAQGNDDLADALFDRCMGHDVLAQRVDHEAAARLFSVYVEPQSNRVEPAVPMYLGPMSALDSTDSPNGVDADGAFLRSEALATLWAVAALSPAPVIGRPCSYGFGGHSSPSAVLTELRADVYEGRAERFQSWVDDCIAYPPSIAKPDDSWSWQCQQTQRIASAADMGISDGPFRGRPMFADEEYEFVMVIEGQAFRSSNVALPIDDVEERSIACVRTLSCNFACVIWAVDAQHVRIARVDPWPQWSHVQYAWPEVGDALIKELLAR